MSPSDLGQLVKPFVFLDLFDVDSDELNGFPMHPHSGIATLTYVANGAVRYEDSTGASGILPSGGVEWMMAGGGVWHTGGPTERRERVSGFQLWIAMPPALENAPAYSRYLSPEELPQVGPARVLLGDHQGVSSPIPAPSEVSYLAVRLRAGETWRFEPEPGQTVAWVSAAHGTVRASAPIAAGEMVVFDEGHDAIDFHADSDTFFVLGSACKHPHELFLGYYSVHTNAKALEKGENGIREVAMRMRSQGRLARRQTRSGAID